MRTTVELPPELMRQAKACAAARGESLKALLARAIASELGRSAHPAGDGRRVRLPLFGNPKGKPVEVSNEDIEGALAVDDLAYAHRALRPRKK
ncbi:MAG: hypothetical protein HY646_13830 [Acidobacteria bacterium]|nr:hypothetical protein [Acidobacteriota bacterium]